MKTGQVMLIAALSAAVVGVPMWLKRRASGDAGQTISAARSDVDGSNAPGSKAPGATAQSLPKIVELGTTTCAPCKAMIGVMSELEQTYADQLVVEFINVQQDESGAARYGVRVIPTQVFLGSDGRELFRHTGFYGTEAIVKKWRELGYPMAPRPRG